MSDNPIIIRPVGQLVPTGVGRNRLIVPNKQIVIPPRGFVVNNRVEVNPYIGNLVTTNDVIIADRKVRAVFLRNKKDNDIQLDMNKKKQDDLERPLFQKSRVCITERLNYLQDRLGKVDPVELKNLMADKFYDPNVMKAAMCISQSIAYTPPIGDPKEAPGGVESNFRIRHWLDSLKQIGGESAEGYALLADMMNVENAFVVKAPRKSNDYGLIHEYIVGIYGTNKLREIIPNYAYIMGGFKCSPPVINPETKKVDAWCNNNKYPIDYVIYENIAPSKTFREYIKTKCSFNDWLSYYLQILLALDIGQKEIDFTHYDLHDDNIVIRNINNNGLVAIPYPTEDGTIYLATNGIATIIDYGFSHIKYEDKNFGSYTWRFGESHVKNSFPLYDAYKLLLTSMVGMLNHGKEECFQGASQILKFFNDRERSVDVVKNQNKYYYELPYNSKTTSVTISDLINYIKENLDASKILFTKPPPTLKIIGCEGNTTCMTSTEALMEAGIEKEIKASTIFDYYDLVSRLKQENRIPQANMVKQKFNYPVQIERGLRKYDDLLRMITAKFENINIYTVTGQPLGNLLDPDYMKQYRQYVGKMVSFFDSLQEITLLYDANIYTIQDHEDFEKESILTNSYQNFSEDINPIWTQMLEYLTTDLDSVKTTLENNIDIYEKAIKQYPELAWWTTGFPDIMMVIH